MLISATLLTACSTNNATSGADGGLKGATFGLKAVHPDNYVEAGFRTLSLPNSLTSNLNIDLTKFNFSNTQIAALPFEIVFWTVQAIFGQTGFRKLKSLRPRVW